MQRLDHWKRLDPSKQRTTVPTRAPLLPDDGRRKRRSRHGEPTADRIVETAAKLFREQGYAQSTTRQISERLGLQKSSLYHHIGGKEDLLYSICVAAATGVLRDVRGAVAEAPPEKKLQEAIVANIVSVIRDGDLHSVLQFEWRALSDERSEEIAALREELHGEFRKLIEDDRRAGRLRVDIAVKYLSLTLMNLLSWALFSFDETSSASPGAFANTLAFLFLEGAQGSPDAPRTTRRGGGR